MNNKGGIGLLLVVAGVAIFGLLVNRTGDDPETSFSETGPATATTIEMQEEVPEVAIVVPEEIGAEEIAAPQIAAVIPENSSEPIFTQVSTAAATQPPRVKMPWETWPKPQLAFILTGEQHGFFEPCGCTSNQMGGMSRRANLVQKMKDAGWLVRGLDVGGLSRRSVRQSQIKFEMTVAALKQLGYIAIGIGPEELRLKPDFLLTQHIVEGDSPLYFLSANIELFGIPDLGTPLPSAVVEAGGLKIGVTSVMSEGLQKLILPFPDVTCKDPVPELQKVVEDFAEQNVDLQFLLSQSTVEESKDLATKFPQFQVVLTAEGTGDPDPSKPPQKVGNTLLIETGRKGKYVGVLGYYPDDEETPFRYQLVALERDDFDETPAMVKLMANFQERLKDEKIVLADAISAPHPSGSTFVGADKCGECHSTALEIWQKTPHARALESLDPVHQRLGFERLNGVIRMHDPECLSCHVTGWDPQQYIRFRSGFLNEDLASDPTEKALHKLMAGSQCENCHGPGSRHIELVEDGSDNAGDSVRVTLEQAKAGTCEKCHDADNSPQFEFDEYWDRVKHYGLD